MDHKNYEGMLVTAQEIVKTRPDSKEWWDVPWPWHLRMGHAGNRQPRWGVIQHWSKPLDFNNPKEAYRR